MNKPEILKLYDNDLRQQVEYPEAHKEVTADVVRFIREAPAMNFVSFAYVDESRLDSVVKNELAYFVPLHQPFTWKVCDHDLLPNAGEILKSNGFVRDDDPGEVMLLDVEHAPAQLLEPVTADIRRIIDPEGLKDIIFVLDKVWGGSNTWVNARLGGHLKVPGYLSAYVAYVDDVPASIGWTYFPKGHFATLFAGSTLPEYRKHGLYTSILATRVQEIRKRGYRYAVVEAGDMSKPIVQKHGFEYLTTVWDYVLEQKKEE
jgi:GNAT superfamily N-acetyltransferase